MKQIIAAAFAATLVATPLAAQSEEEDGTDFLGPLFEQWADRTEDMMREMFEELGPEMEELMNRMVPRLEEFADQLGGIRHYELPEILPNGDIIIRRKEDAPPLPEDFAPDPDTGAIDL